MKTVKLYEFSELSATSQDVAIDEAIKNQTFLYLFEYEQLETCNVYRKIGEIFGFEIGRDGLFSVDIIPENSDLISGYRLQKYIWNNYSKYLYRGKYYSTAGKYIDGEYSYIKRHSKVFLDKYLTITGYYSEGCILESIYNFLNSKDIQNVTIYDLIDSINTDYQHFLDDAYNGYLEDRGYIRELLLESNDIFFLKTGKLIGGI